MKNTINVEDDKLIISTTIFGETIKTQVSITKDMIKQKSDLSKYDSALPADEFNFIVDNFLNIIKANPRVILVILMTQENTIIMHLIKLHL